MLEKEEYIFMRRHRKKAISGGKNTEQCGGRNEPGSCYSKVSAERQARIQGPKEGLESDY